MISQKAKYGLKAALFLAKRYAQGPVLITDIAREEGMPQKFLEAILLELKKSGLLLSKKGKGGGYILGKHPDEIMMGDIIRLLDGPLAPVSCVSETAYARCKDCVSEEQCEIRMVMKEVRDAMSNILDRSSLADAIERAQINRKVENFVI